MMKKILLFFLALAAGVSAEFYEGEFHRIASIQPIPIASYLLYTPVGDVYNLMFHNEVDIYTGDRGIVEGKLVPNDDLYSNAIRVDNYYITDYALRKQDITKVYNVTSLVFIMNVCNRQGINKSILESKWTSATTKNTETFQNYIEQCSYSKYAFPSSRNLIVGPIDIPCNSTRYNYDSNKCGGNEIYGWATFVQDYAVEVLGIDVSQFRHKLFMLPSGLPCAWAGLGTLGCGSSCYTWYNGRYGTDLSVIMHELGHNFGLDHSSTPIDEYGDRSCAMGGCCGNRCFNVPQSWELGFTSPIAILNGSTFQTGNWFNYEVPAHLINSKNFVRIDMRDKSSYFISFRQSISFDQYLLTSLKNKVFVHRYNTSRTFLKLPVLLSVLSPTAFYSIPEANIVIKFNSILTNNAYVSICRMTGPEICGDGLDNDCNGYIDSEDLVCKTTNPPPPPISSSSPPPRSFPSPPPPISSLSPPPPPISSLSPPPPRSFPSPPPRSFPSPPPPPISSSSPPPYNSELRTVSVKVKKILDISYIINTLCPKLSDALAKAKVTPLLQSCTVKSSSSAYYYNIDFYATTMEYNNLRNYISGCMEEFTYNAYLYCDSSTTWYETKNDKVIFRYNSIYKTCLNYNIYPPPSLQCNCKCVAN